MNQTEASAIYQIATGCILTDSVTKPRSIVDGHFRDPIMKCLCILELSEKYSFQKLNIEKFATSRDTMINADSLALSTILASKQGQIIDYESKRTYPLTLNNLHFTCGETLQFEGIASGYSIIPKPSMMSVKHWPNAMLQKLCDSQHNFHNIWNHDDAYQVKQVRGKRKRLIDLVFHFSQFLFIFQTLIKEPIPFSKR